MSCCGIASYIPRGMTTLPQVTLKEMLMVTNIWLLVLNGPCPSNCSTSLPPLLPMSDDSPVLFTEGSFSTLRKDTMNSWSFYDLALKMWKLKYTSMRRNKGSNVN